MREIFDCLLACVREGYIQFVLRQWFMTPLPEFICMPILCFPRSPYRKGGMGGKDPNKCAPFSVKTTALISAQVRGYQTPPMRSHLPSFYEVISSINLQSNTGGER